MVYFNAPSSCHRGSFFERWFFNLPNLECLTIKRTNEIYLSFQNIKTPFTVYFLGEAEKSQPKGWNPANPHNSPAGRFFNLVKEKLTKSRKIKQGFVEKHLRFYVAVGTGCDVMCHTDCFFRLFFERAYATIDLTANPNKEENKTDVILSLSDIESLKDEEKAQRVADVLISRFMRAKAFHDRKKIRGGKKRFHKTFESHD